MKELTIDEIVYLWSVKYKYDYVLHGFTFKEDTVISEEKAVKNMDHLNSLYGDLI